MSHIDLIMADAATKQRILEELAKPIIPKGPRRRTHSMASEAPIVLLRYECPMCKEHQFLNPYDGPPVCQNKHPKVWMIGLSLISPVDPLADVRDEDATGQVR